MGTRAMEPEPEHMHSASSSSSLTTSDEEPPARRRAEPLSARSASQARQLRRLSKRLKKENNALEEQLEQQRRRVRRMEAQLEDEERSVQEMREEVAELQSETCPVCKKGFPQSEIDGHMEQCLRALTEHVAGSVRESHAATLALQASEAQAKSDRIRRQSHRSRHFSPPRRASAAPLRAAPETTAMLLSAYQVEDMSRPGAESWAGSSVPTSPARSPGGSPERPRQEPPAQPPRSAPTPRPGDDRDYPVSVREHENGQLVFEVSQ